MTTRLRPSFGFAIKPPSSIVGRCSFLPSGSDQREGLSFYSRGMKFAVRPKAVHLLLAIDLVGTALFAAEGASTAVQARLDLLGMLVLAFVTALGGGIVRDLLIGDVPPSSIRDWHYAAVALATGAAVFVLRAYTSGMNHWLLTTLDAAGLSFFA